MCEITTALAIGGAILGYVSDRQQANAEVEAIEENYAEQQKAVQAQQQQINSNAKDEVSQRAREAMIERGKLRAIQGESGLTGNTQSRIMGESYFNEGTDIATIEANRRNTLDQSAREAKGVRTQNQSAINTVKQPNLIGAGLQIGTAVATSKGVQKWSKKTFPKLTSSTDT